VGNDAIATEASSRRSGVSLGVSIFLLVVGAILTFAVDVTASGFSINTVGIILMVAGALGLVLSLLFWSSFSPYRRGGTVVGLGLVPGVGAARPRLRPSPRSSTSDG
jgi:hypothetical protein